jgi:hypothetical protein
VDADDPLVLILNLRYTCTLHAKYARHISKFDSRCDRAYMEVLVAEIDRLFGRSRRQLHWCRGAAGS